MDLRLALVGMVSAMIAVMATMVAAVDKYPTKFDYLNIDQILKNNRLLKSYYKCIVDIGPCTQEGFEFRKAIPDALRTRCRKCNPLQKKNGRKVVEYVQKHRPEMWEGALNKFDPTRQLTKDILTDPDFLGPPSPGNLTKV